MPKRKEPTAPPQRVGTPLAEWCYAAGISDSLFYKLDEATRPATVRLGCRKVIVIEPPADWLVRMDAARRAQAPKETVAA